MTEIEQEIMGLLAFEWRGRQQHEIVAEIKRPKTSVRDSLLRLEEAGQVERVEGRWYLGTKAARVERVEPVETPEPEEVEPEVEEVAPLSELAEKLATIGREELEKYERLPVVPSAELDAGPAEPEPEPGNRDEPEPWHPAPEVEIRVTVPTWLARRIFEVLEEAAREARGV